MMAMPETRGSYLARRSMAYVLAGGRGSRLLELTDRRAKPAVFFGGKSRIIDFALSNALNSGIRRIGVATQYKAHSLIRHLQRGWSFLRPERNEGFDILPASQRISEDKWYAGTADAVYQNIDIIDGYGPDYMLILAGDHIYKMDYELMLEQHVNSGADVTVGCLEVPRMEATGFGVMHIDENDRIVDFLEKPADPPGMPDKPDMALASMGIYVFDTKFMFEQLKRDAADPDSARDFGKDIIPYLVKNGKADRPSLSQFLRQVRGPKDRTSPIGGTSARSTPTGRPISISPTSPRPSTSTTRTGRSGPMPRSPRPRSSSMTRTAGAAWQPAPWSPAAASSPAAGSTARCCSPACTPIPTASSKASSPCPMSISARRRS